MFIAASSRVNKKFSFDSNLGLAFYARIRQIQTCSVLPGTICCPFRRASASSREAERVCLKPEPSLTPLPPPLLVLKGGEDTHVHRTTTQIVRRQPLKSVSSVGYTSLFLEH